MRQYEYFIKEAKKNGEFIILEQVNSERLEEMKNLNPGIPSDYMFFLKEVGACEFNQRVFCMYSGLLQPDEIVNGDEINNFKGVLLFGDDMQGYSCGFDTNNNWSIVEVDSTDMSMECLFDNFSDFIQDKLKWI